jgi:transcriptional regulator with XRE-family HTH domain
VPTAPAPDLEELAQLGPEELERLARTYERMAKLLRAMAQALPIANSKRVRDSGGVTQEQLEDRAKAISQAYARRKGDAFLRAVADSEWRSMRTYATDRLGVSPATLTGYRNGRAPVPAEVAAKVWADFRLRLPLKK